MHPLILLVDDNSEILMYIKTVLEHNEFRVITATDGKDGLKVLSESSDIPDLIISDIMMPVLDGYEFFKAVTKIEKFANIPLIFLSALDSPEDIRLAKAIGADNYLVKPIDEDILIAMVSKKIIKDRD